jgi:hypothetical protein
MRTTLIHSKVCKNKFQIYRNKPPQQILGWPLPSETATYCTHLAGFLWGRHVALGSVQYPHSTGHSQHFRSTQFNFAVKICELIKSFTQRISRRHTDSCYVSSKSTQIILRNFFWTICCRSLTKKYICKQLDTRPIWKSSYFPLAWQKNWFHILWKYAEWAFKSCKYLGNIDFIFFRIEGPGEFLWRLKQKLKSLARLPLKNL